MPDKNKLLAELEQYHKQKNFSRIINKIESLPQAKQQDYTLIGLLARAYENLAQIGDKVLLEKAILLLQKIKYEGQTDPKWHFRMGYALFYLGRQQEAKPHFAAAAELLGKYPTNEERAHFLQDSLDYLKYCDSDIGSTQDIKTYNEMELNLLHAHIEHYFGKIDRILYENIVADIYVDIYVIKPTKRHNYYTLVTVGMGAHKMNIPTDLLSEHLDRAELVINLPANWDVGNTDEKWYWPIRWLRILARLPIGQKSWIGWGHSISNEDDVPFASNTLFSALMLTSLIGQKKEANCCLLPDNSEVNFYNLLPLYPEELEYKCQYDAESLLHLFYHEKIRLSPLKLDRINAATKYLKNFKIKARNLKLLLLNWDEPDGCIISDRITVKGESVGYFYREEAAGDWDSGWRFFSGAETQDDLNDPDKGDVYHLNTICNYDKDVMLLLNSPIGSAFFRNEDGHFSIYKDKIMQKNILLVN